MLNARRALAGVLLAVATMAAAVPAASAGSDTVQSGLWQALADKVYNNAAANYNTLVAQGKNVQSYHVAAIAWYAGQRFGWQDDRTQTWLRRTYARKTASRGYGIGFSHDYFSDRTWNPADTTYSITTSWHVGRLLIAGHDGGGIPAQEVIDAVTALLNTPQTPNRQCLAYSKHPNDSRYPCIWNVGAAGAWFLLRAHQRGLYPPARAAEIVSKLTTWREYVRAHYSTSLGGWNYIEGGPNVLDNPGHLGATVQAMYEADPTIGPTALEAYWRHYTGSVSAAELVYYDCSKADVSYPPVADFALSDRGSPAANMGLAVWAPIAQRVATGCLKPSA